MKNVDKTIVDIFKPETNVNLLVPFFEEVRAGFPTEVFSEGEVSIDLNKELIRNPEATFYARVKGLSMTGCGIDDGDLVIIDRSLEPEDGKIAVCFLDGEFTLKRIKKDKQVIWLVPENPSFPLIKVDERNQFQIWGILAYAIKKF